MPELQNAFAASLLDVLPPDVVFDQPRRCGRQLKLNMARHRIISGVGDDGPPLLVASGGSLRCVEVRKALRRPAGLRCLVAN
jgi:hypothetical protein